MPLTGPDGAITTSEALLWADEPARAISLNLAQILSRMSGGVAAVEPWPLLDRAKLRLDVRVQTLVAQSNGTLRFAGQYFLVPEDEGRPKVEWFDFLVPMSASTGPEIARATGVATQELARLVLSK